MKNELSFKQRMHNSKQPKYKKQSNAERRAYELDKKDYTLYPSYKFTLGA